MKKNLFVVVVLLLSAVLSVQAQKVKVACIGNSITYGATIENREVNSYPAQLQRLLGADYEVVNFGVSATVAQKAGDHPWINTEKYKEAVAFAPQIAVIKLGTNDSKPHNWESVERFITDLEALATEFESRGARILVALPAKVYQLQWGINDEVITRQQIPAIKKMAKKHKWQIIDLHKATSKMPEHFPDYVHPDAYGASVIASTVYQAILKPKK